MADPKWRTEIQKLSDFYKNWYRKLLNDAKSEFDIILSKFNMADPKWRTGIKKLSDFYKNWYPKIFEISKMEHWNWKIINDIRSC